LALSFLVDVPPPVEKKATTKRAVIATFDFGKNFEAVGRPIAAIHGQDFNGVGLVGQGKLP
jgi:hypothetical protein